MKLRNSISGSIRKLSGLLCFAILLSIGIEGCTRIQKGSVDQARLSCSLLGSYCDKLSEGAPGQKAVLRYVDPAVNWSQYRKVYIAPVTYWGNDQSRASQSDQQHLIDYFHRSLQDKFSKSFQVVDEPEAGSMTLTVALIEADSATPILRSISMIIPQARALSTLTYLPTGSYPFVGGAQVEGKVTDSATGNVMAAVVDRRLGGGHVATGFQWRWGDVRNAMDFWSETAANRLAAWRDGTERP